MIAANVTSRWRFLRQIFCFIMYTKVRLRGNPLTTTVITGEWLREMSSRRPNICDSSVSLLDPVRGNLSQSHHDHQLSPAWCVHSWGWLLWYFWYRRWCLCLRIKSDSFRIYPYSNYFKIWFQGNTFHALGSKFKPKLAGLQPSRGIITIQSYWLSGFKNKMSQLASKAD